MGVIVLIPKRKTQQTQIRDKSGNVTSISTNTPVNTVTFTIGLPQTLSNLIVDMGKDWVGYPIENIGEASSNLGAARAYDLTSAIEFVIDGGGSAITTGEKGHIRMPFAGTIISAALVADQVGSIVVDIWKDSYADFPPTIADSITASAKPTISSAQKDLDTTLTGWTKTFAYGDILAFNVDSCSTITRVTLTLIVRRT